MLDNPLRLNRLLFPSLFLSPRFPTIENRVLLNPMIIVAFNNKDKNSFLRRV